MSRLGLVVIRRSAWYTEAEGPRFDSPLRFPFFQSSTDCGLNYRLSLVCDDFALHISRNIELAHIAAHVNAEIVLVVTVYRVRYKLPPPSPLLPPGSSHGTSDR